MNKKTIVALNCACVDVFEQSGEIHPGGEALNFCGNISDRKDLEVYLMGAIGKDAYGKAILNKVKNYNINLQYLQVVDGITANNHILLTDEGDRYFPENAWTDGLYGSFTLSDSDKAFLSTADAVHTTIGAPVFPTVLEVRKTSHFLLSVDFNEFRDFAKWESFVPYIDVFFISGSLDILPQLQKWSESYDGVFVATLAADGSVAYQHGHKFVTNAVKVNEVIDTTGCGDSYQAGFMASYCLHMNVLKAMEAGSLQASKTLAHLGGF